MCPVSWACVVPVASGPATLRPLCARPGGGGRGRELERCGLLPPPPGPHYACNFIHLALQRRDSNIINKENSVLHDYRFVNS
jgi:hypothetical protein